MVCQWAAGGPATVGPDLLGGSHQAVAVAGWQWRTAADSDGNGGPEPAGMAGLDTFGWESGLLGATRIGARAREPHSEPARMRLAGTPAVTHVCTMPDVSGRMVSPAVTRVTCKSGR